MKIEANIPQKPHAGVWGDDNVYKAYEELYKDLHNIISREHNLQNFQIKGTREIVKSQASAIVAKAKIFEMYVKSICSEK